MAFEHLRALGHEKIALLSGPEKSALVRERQQTFYELLQRDGLEEFPTVRTGTDWNLSEAQVAQISAILADEQRPTAYLCMGDLLAMHALKIARALGLEVPRDLSLVGYGNFLISEISVPALSSISQPFHQMGHSVAVQLLRALAATSAGACDSESAGDSPFDFTEILPVHLVTRESSGPAPTNLLA